MIMPEIVSLNVRAHPILVVCWSNVKLINHFVERDREREEWNRGVYPLFNINYITQTH